MRSRPAFLENLRHIENRLMPGTGIEFVPCDSETRIPEIFAQGIECEFLALGTAGSLSLTLESMTDELSKGSVTEIRVFPIGTEGRLVWKQMPVNLSVLAAPPIQTALVVIPTQFINGAEDVTISEWVSHHASLIKKHRPLEASPDTAVPLPALTPQISSMPSWLQAKAASFTLENAKSEPDAIALKAGLFQIYGELDRSHEYSQNCQGEGKHVAGDYWHAIMHRREPDYGNSKYWFRRVGDNPIFEKLSEHATEILNSCQSSEASVWNHRITSGGWDAFAFVNMCETCSEGNDVQLELAAQQIQWREMMLLLDQTYQDAAS